MRKQYLHLYAYPCDSCSGPVVVGSVAVRENEISRETGVKAVGAICLSCGRRPDKPADPARIRHFPTAGWDQIVASDDRVPTGANSEALDRAPLVGTR